MNIIELAERAGFYFRDAGYAPEVLHTEPYEYSQRCFERFATLVRAAVLEEAAKVALAEPHIWDINAPDPQHRIAAAIRGLGHESKQDATRSKT